MGSRLRVTERGLPGFLGSPGSSRQEGQSERGSGGLRPHLMLSAPFEVRDHDFDRRTGSVAGVRRRGTARAPSPVPGGGAAHPARPLHGGRLRCPLKGSKLQKRFAHANTSTQMVYYSRRHKPSGQDPGRRNPIFSLNFPESAEKQTDQRVDRAVASANGLWARPSAGRAPL